VPIAEFVEHILAFAAQDGIRYDLLHGHYADGWETATALKACWNHHPPLVLTTHSLGRRKRADCLVRNEMSLDELNLRYNFPVRIASEERSLAGVERILPLSTVEEEYLLDHYQAVSPDDSRMTIIPNGIDPSNFSHPPPKVKSQVRHDLGVANSEFLLLAPSRMVSSKGQLNILQALVEARSKLSGRLVTLLFLACPEPSNGYAMQIKQYIASSTWLRIESAVHLLRMKARRCY